jgi:zinc D-Ala-D-Ala carboxypeptidase
MKAQWNLYPNFSKHEFDCKHTGLNEMDHSFMSLLQEARVRYGKPMTISSGYRHPTHPVEARKGHTNGEHTKGRCADITINNSTDRYTLLKIAFDLGFTRIGFHKSFLHLGIGAENLPNNVAWDY